MNVKLLKEMIKRIVKEESSSSKKVTVTGDRGMGKFEVELIKREREFEIEGEIIYSAKISTIIKADYDYKVGDKVYVVKKQSGATPTNFGEIDPFIGEDE